MSFEFKVLKSDGTVSDVGAKSAVVSMTKAEFSALTSDNIAEYYNDGVREIIVEDGYTNLVPTAIDENGNLYQGCGYLNGYRLTSSNVIAESFPCCVSGYMPYTHGSKIRITGFNQLITRAGQYIGIYDASFGLIEVKLLNTIAKTTSRDDGFYEATIDTNAHSIWSNASYFRVSCNGCVGEDLIVTIDEEIGLEV